MGKIAKKAKTIEGAGNAAENSSKNSMKAKGVALSEGWPVLNRQYKAGIFAIMKAYLRNFCTGIGRR